MKTKKLLVAFLVFLIIGSSNINIFAQSSTDLKHQGDIISISDIDVLILASPVVLEKNEFDSYHTTVRLNGDRNAVTSAMCMFSPEDEIPTTITLPETKIIDSDDFYPETKLALHEINEGIRIKIGFTGDYVEYNLAVYIPE